MKLNPIVALALFIPLGLFGCEDKKDTSAAPAAVSAAPASTTSTTGAANGAPSTGAGGATTAAVAPATGQAPTAPPGDYDIDTSHSRLGFSVRHMMVSNVRGQFTKWSGHAHIDEGNLAASNVALEIDPTSIDTNEPKRDTHLKSPDFFDTAKFPKMTFVSKSIERSGAGYKVTGDLTMRDVTKSIVLDVDALSPEQKDPWGGLRRGTHATGKLNRKDFGLSWGKVMESGGAVVGDEVTLDIEIEMTKKVAK